MNRRNLPLVIQADRLVSLEVLPWTYQLGLRGEAAIAAGRPIVLRGAHRAAPAVLRWVYELAGLGAEEART